MFLSSGRRLAHRLLRVAGALAVLSLVPEVFVQGPTIIGWS